jgi:hypothetical protein
VLTTLLVELAPDESVAINIAKELIAEPSA